LDFVEIFFYKHLPTFFRVGHRKAKYGVG